MRVIILHPYTKFEIRRPCHSEDIVHNVCSINRPSDPDLWPFDLETGVRVTSKVGNFPSKFGHARPLGSRIIRYVCDWQTDRRTDGWTKATLITPSYGRGGHKNIELWLLDETACHYQLDHTIAAVLQTDSLTFEIKNNQWFIWYQVLQPEAGLRQLTIQYNKIVADETCHDIPYLSVWLWYVCVKPSARHGIAESFTLRLAPNPISSVAGGARLSTDHVTCTIEPRGLLQFTQQSRDVTTDVTGTLAQVLAVCEIRKL